MYKIDSNLTASPTWVLPHRSVSNKKEKLKLQTPLNYFAISVIKTNQFFEHFIFFVLCFGCEVYIILGQFWICADCDCKKMINHMMRKPRQLCELGNQKSVGLRKKIFVIADQLSANK